ncbi:TonB-dependent receptor [Novosphingobium nitrogenifigens]|nr:TonB-dependent receptor [Novosphingobium nitrogenifigens]
MHRFPLCLSLLALPTCAFAADATDGADGTQIVVTASRRDLLGQAGTASQGSVSREEIALRPIYRPGQLFESIPGLVVTIHSGEGKAQQYLIRGYNLDHGTDFANFVDDMPVNRPTNAHGQGYSDLGFLIPQLVAGIDYTKGPYSAAIGDFGSVAAAHTRLVDAVPTQASVTVGTDGYQDVFTGGTLHLSGGRRLLGALDLAHYDGPWQPGQNFRKVNGVLRYGEGTANDGFTVTAMAYASQGRLITDQPERAIEQGLISRYGTLDPTDTSKSQRYSLSARFAKPVGPGQLAVSLYAIRSTMTLWNNFTHYLDDPVYGDQEEQDEQRTTLGGAASYTVKASLAGIGLETVAGLMLRYDAAFVDRKHTWHRDTILPTCYQQQDDGPTYAYAAVGGNCTADHVRIVTVSPYVQETVRWTPWLRTVLGLRADYTHASDHSDVSGIRGSGGQWLAQPKGSLILGPWARTEFYFSAGRGFHSNDVRGVFGTVPNEGGGTGGATPFLSATTGIEAGMRTNIVPHLSLQFAAFQQDFGSELVYNPDTGQDEAGAPSRRQGIEISAQYHPFGWLELNTDLAFSRPRYRTDNLAAYGLAEPYIADAPNFIYSAGVLVDGLGSWSGSLQWRRLGTHSLDDGHLYPQDSGYSEWNLEAGYAFRGGWKVQVGIFNLFNSRDASADYYYVSRLPGEASDGVAGFQTHPLEPRSARFTLAKVF